MWYAFRKYQVQPGAHAEVTGITSGPLGIGQRGLLVIAYQSGSVKTSPLRKRRNVRGGLRFAARFNAACQATAQPKLVTSSVRS